MNCRSSVSLPRACGVMLLLVAWFAMSNHCALAVISGVPVRAVVEVQKGCCSSQSTGGEGQHEVPSRACCKSIRALPIDVGAKVLQAPDRPLLVELAWGALMEKGTGEGAVQIAPAETGPPEVHSFAEVVLQRSLLSHAPPFAV